MFWVLKYADYKCLDHRELYITVTLEREIVSSPVTPSKWIEIEKLYSIV